jgi:hypothetical protein
MSQSTTAVSARKLAANRANSQKSTGPKTEAGKARSSQNRVSHGFFSTHLLLPGESQRELDALRDELVADVRPRGAVERLLVERLIAAHWKLRRLQQAEEQMMRHFADKQKNMTPADMQAAMIFNGAEADRLSAYQNRLDHSIHRIMRELRMMRKEERQEREEREEMIEELPPSPRLGERAGERGEEERSMSDVGLVGAAARPLSLTLSPGRGEGTGGAETSVARNVRNEPTAAVAGHSKSK